MKKSLVAAALAVLVLGAAPATAATYNFFKLTNNNVENVGGQLSVDVQAFSATQVSFRFENAVGIASSIADIYFDDGLPAILALPMTFLQSAGVSFNDPATPGNLPGGNGASPAFVTSTGLSADSDSPVSQNGVNAATEFLTIILNYTGANTLSTVLAALGSGDLRIGLHVQSIGQAGGSDGYINNTVDISLDPIPIPGGIILLLTGLVGLGALARMRKPSKTA